MSGSSNYHSNTNCFDHASGFNKIERIFDAKGRKLKILDLGCGDGRLSAELVRQGHEVTGLDSHANGLAEAEKNGLKIVQADIEKPLPFNDKSFDTILLLDVLEHLYNQANVLGEVNRVLRDDGSVLVAYPNHFDLRNRINILCGGGIVHWDHKKYANAKAWSYGHIRLLLLKELLELLETKNFYPRKIQFNFMSGGFIPTKFTPKKLRIYLLKSWPQIFTGKYVLEVTKTKEKNIEKIYLSKTERGI
jgi:methionine biosynthesis protein MetW